MDPLFIGYACVFALFLCLALGVPVGVALGLTGVGGMYFGLSEAFAFGQIRTLPFSVAHNYGFAVLPLFVLMGIVAQRSGMTEKLFQATDLWLRSVKGGMYQVVIVGSAIFAAISGSTVVNSLVFTRIAFPEMLKAGYSRSLSIGAIAASGGFAAMIPPSITMVIYGIMTEQSIGRLFIAGMIPGLLSALSYMVVIAVLVRVKPDLSPKIRSLPPLSQKLRSLVWVWPFALIFVVVIGGLYSGMFPPSGAGAVGAAAALAVAFVYRKGKLTGWFLESLRDAAAISCVLFVILIGGMFFSRMLIVLGVIPNMIGLINQFDL
jgi:C4-dicarboxylate transporter DctM subunit